MLVAGWASCSRPGPTSVAFLGSSSSSSLSLDGRGREDGDGRLRRRRAVGGERFWGDYASLGPGSADGAPQQRHGPAVCALLRPRRLRAPPLAAAVPLLHGHPRGHRRRRLGQRRRPRQVPRARRRLAPPRPPRHQSGGPGIRVRPRRMRGDLPDRLKLLRKNVNLNVDDPHVAGSAKVTDLVWGEDPHPNLMQQPLPDFLLGSDVIYNEEAVEDLLLTLHQLSGQHTTILLAGELRNDAVLECFLEAAMDNFLVGCIEQDQWHPDFRSNRVALFILVKKPPTG